MTKEEKLSKKLQKFGEDNKEVLAKIAGLSLDRLIEHLKEASKYKNGYYKNRKGEYIHIKGVEVTNDTINLGRMGFNGEDRGVWIHYCLVDDKSVTYIDCPVFMFSGTYFNKAACKPDELMHKTTREDFEEKVRNTVETLCGEYKEAVDPKEYLKVTKGWNKLFEDFVKLTGLGGFTSV